MNRLTDFCLWCVCYHLNWDEEVRETMDKQSPGDSCSQGMEVGKREECLSFQSIREEVRA